jgi:hypothetical protein
MSFNPGDIVVEDHRYGNICVVQSPERGTSVVAAKDITAKSQVMLVDHPLLIALDTPNLAGYCYSCFKTAKELPRDVQGQAPSLQRCSGCKVVRFCNKVRETPQHPWYLTIANVQGRNAKSKLGRIIAWNASSTPDSTREFFPATSEPWSVY